VLGPGVTMTDADIAIMICFRHFPFLWEEEHRSRFIASRTSGGWQWEPQPVVKNSMWECRNLKFAERAVPRRSRA
jgi:hypothetical protein